MFGTDGGWGFGMGLGMWAFWILLIVIIVALVKVVGSGFGSPPDRGYSLAFCEWLRGNETGITERPGHGPGGRIRH